MKTKITDVAKMAGVSTATVSHVINNTRFVSDVTREKVLQVINELNYVPDVSARGFKTGKKKLICFINPLISYNFYATLMESIEAVLAERDYRLMVVNSHASTENEQNILKTVSNGLVDGVIITSCADNYEQIRSCIPDNFPITLLDATYPGAPFDSVTSASFRATYDSIKHLINRGHTRIGVMIGLLQLSTCRERLAAYKKALSDAHIPFDESLVRSFKDASDDPSPLVQDLLEKKCTALFFTNPKLLWDGFKGYNVNEPSIIFPKELDIVSFCDSPFYRNLMSGMMIIEQPTEEMGRLAGEQILRRLDGDMGPVREIVMQSVFKKNI